MAVDKRLRMLAVTHLALGAVTGVLAQIEPSTPYRLNVIPIVPLFASALCEAFLLALWGATCPAALWKRLAGLFAGSLYLEALLETKLRYNFLGMTTITIAVTTVFLLIVQWLGVGLTRHEEVGQPARLEPEGLKFSIRGLMIFTATVALLCAVARALHTSPKGRLLLMFVWAMCFVAVGLFALWAALGSIRPLRRSAVVLMLSQMLGVFFAFAASVHIEDWIALLLIMLLYPMALLGSLLVVRSCGYRLVRSAVASTGPTEDRGRSVGSFIS